MTNSIEDRECSGSEPIGRTHEEGIAPRVPEYNLSKTIEQSRKLIRESLRIIAESYSDERRKH